MSHRNDLPLDTTSVCRVATITNLSCQIMGHLRYEPQHLENDLCRKDVGGPPSALT